MNTKYTTVNCPPFTTSCTEPQNVDLTVLRREAFIAIGENGMALAGKMVTVAGKLNKAAYSLTTLIPGESKQCQRLADELTDMMETAKDYNWWSAIADHSGWAIDMKAWDFAA